MPSILRVATLVAPAVVAAALLGSSPAPATAGTTLSVNVSCLSMGHGNAECYFWAGGGTGVYTYTWSPPPFFYRDNETVFIHCMPNQYQQVTLTVTDSNGATGSATYTFYCGSAA